MAERTFGSKMDELKYLRVVIQSCQFEKTSNYFVMCTLQELSGKFEQKTFRTDVQKNTNSPVFATNDFFFKVPWGRTPNRFNDSLNNSKQRNEEPLSPSVYFQVFEVVPGEMEKWTAQQISTESYYFENDLAMLLSGQQVAATLAIKGTKSNRSSNQGEPENSLGTIVVDISAADRMPNEKSSEPSDNRFMNLEEETKLIFDSSYIKQPISFLISEPNQHQENFPIKIQIHCALNLPLVPSGTDQPPMIPSPFVSSKTTIDAKERKPAKCTTFAVSHDRSPLWREKLEFAFSLAEFKANAGLFLAVIDSQTKKYLGKFIVPLENAVFGEQYNLALMLNSESFVLMSTEFEPLPNYVASLFEANPNLINIEVLLKGLNTKLPSTVCAFASIQFQENIAAFVTSMTSKFNAIKNGTGSSTPGMPFQCITTEESPSLVVSGVKLSSLSEDSPSPQWDEVISMKTWKENYETTSSGIVIQLFQVKPDKDEGTTVFIGYAVISFQEIKALGSGISEAGMPIVLDKVKLDLNPGFSSTVGDEDMFITVELRCYSAANYLASLGQPTLAPSINQSSPQAYITNLAQSTQSLKAEVHATEKSSTTNSNPSTSSPKSDHPPSSANVPSSRPSTTKVPEIVFPKEKDTKPDPSPPSLSRSPREKTLSTKSLVSRDSDLTPLVEKPTSVPSVVVPAVSPLMEKMSSPQVSPIGNVSNLSLNLGDKEEDPMNTQTQPTTNQGTSSPTTVITPQDPSDFPKTADVTATLMDSSLIEKSFFDLDNFTKSMIRIQAQMSELVKENMRLEKELKDKRRRPGSRDIGRSGSFVNDEKVKMLTEQLAKKTEQTMTLEKKVMELEKQCKNYQEIAEKSNKEVLHLSKFKTTAVKQEEVIEKLESLLTKAVVKSKGYKEVILGLQEELKTRKSPGSHEGLSPPNFEGYNNNIGDKPNSRTGSPWNYRRSQKLQPIEDQQQQQQQN